jgi:hypothetical protein
MDPTTSGNPSSLGQLHVVNLQYGGLDPGDYAAGGAYIASIGACSSGPLDVTSRVQAMVMEVEFQVRIYFDGSNWDGEVDDTTYSGPSLEVVYIIQ